MVLGLAFIFYTFDRRCWNRASVCEVFVAWGVDTGGVSVIACLVSGSRERCQGDVKSFLFCFVHVSPP